MKATHRKILDKIAQYLETEGADHLRFTQALFNLGINEFEDRPDDFVFRDNHNDSDEEVIGRIIKNFYR